MLIVDIDKLFKNYVKDYLASNKGKISGDTEEVRQTLLEAFGDVRLSELGGFTPATFYSDKKDKLVFILKEHFRLDVPVSEFLIDALIDYADVCELSELLDDSYPEDLLLIVLEVLAHKDIKNAVNGLIGLLFSEICDDCVKDAVLGILEYYDGIADMLVEKCKGLPNISGAVCELLSKQKGVCPEISQILISEFEKHYDLAPEYCSYLVAYGDESALPTLYKALESADDYINYKEIGLAIEALGGNFSNDKDFSNDKNYKKIKETKDEH